MRLLALACVRDMPASGAEVGAGWREAWWCTQGGAQGGIQGCTLPTMVYPGIGSLGGTLLFVIPGLWEPGRLSSLRYSRVMGAWEALFTVIPGYREPGRLSFHRYSRVLGRQRGCYSPLFPGIREAGRL